MTALAAGGAGTVVFFATLLCTRAAFASPRWGWWAVAAFAVLSVVLATAAVYGRVWLLLAVFWAAGVFTALLTSGTDGGAS